MKKDARYRMPDTGMKRRMGNWRIGETLKLFNSKTFEHFRTLLTLELQIVIYLQINSESVPYILGS